MACRCVADGEPWAASVVKGEPRRADDANLGAKHKADVADSNTKHKLDGAH